MRTWKNSVFGHFLRSDKYVYNAGKSNEQGKEIM